MLTLKVLNKDKEVLACEKGHSVNLNYSGAYTDGDSIRVESSIDKYIAVKFDETLCESIIFIPGKSFEFAIPSEEVRIGCYGEEAFAGENHTICAREISEEEFYSYRKISLNSHDIHGKSKSYPHTWANFVTRENPVFYARNAIDGVIHNESHGAFPYHSWAGGAREDLDFKLDFGQPVSVDKIVFFLRAHFPHDTYWKSVDVEFSDGSVEHAEFEGVAEGQSISFEAKETTYVRLVNFKQVSYPLSWAALTQIEVFGNYIKEDLSKMEVRQASNAKDAKHYTTERLREEFHIANLFTKDNTRMVYSHIDRIITAGVMPVFCLLKYSVHWKVLNHLQSPLLHKQSLQVSSLQFLQYLLQ